MRELSLVTDEDRVVGLLATSGTNCYGTCVPSLLIHSARCIYIVVGII